MLLWGNTGKVSILNRLEELKSRSRAHEGRISALLAKPQPEGPNLSFPPAAKRTPLPSPKVPTPESDIPFVRLPDFPEPPASPDAGFVPDSPTRDESDEVSEEDKALSAGKDSDDIDEAYAELYSSDESLRREGYYFGPLIGFAFPDDGAIRSGGVIDSFTSDGGYLIGFQVGKDFGSVRAEGEYSYMGYDGSGSVSVGVNNLLARIILETEVGEALDFRAGMGMGFGFVGIDGGSSGEPSDVGFAYDFLLGFGYNFSDGWSLCADYRYYLSAANDAYDRIKSHALLFSANFDI